MHVLIVGGRGQLGRALHVQFDRESVSRVSIWDRPEVDITQPSVSDELVALNPDVVINAAAWTDVDAAENAPDVVYAVNALGPKYLAEACRRLGIFLVQISTNEVFEGRPASFYREYDTTGARSVYARSKLAGERAVMAHHDRWIIARIAWLFGSDNRNFPAKILAAADQHGALRVVDDEVGNPTYAPDVAVAVDALLQREHSGIYHLVNDGYASRFDLAAHLLNVSGRANIPLTPISLDDWQRPSKPPRHAVLVNQAAAALGIRLRPWQDAVSEYAASLVKAGV